MNAWYHAKASAARWGGKPEDYLPVHDFIDESKAIIADVRHRALRHHAEGIFQASQVLGPTVVNSNGIHVPVRLIGEQHVTEDLGFIPSFAEYARAIQVAPWMTGEGRPARRANI